MEKTELWALLWSKQANCFHIEPLERSAEAGKRFFKANQTNDYLLLSYGSFDEVSALADELRPACLERETVRRLYADKYQ